MTDWPDYWTTRQMDIFISQPDGNNSAGYLPQTSLLGLKWIAGAQCSYCGLSNCGCGAGDNIHKLGNAIALFEYIMPVGMKLFYLQDGGEIEIVRRCCGRRDQYISDEVHIVLGNCKVIQKQTSEISSREDECLVLMQVEVECSVTLYPYGRGYEEQKIQS